MRIFNQETVLEPCHLPLGLEVLKDKKKSHQKGITKTRSKKEMDFIFPGNQIKFHFIAFNLLNNPNFCNFDKKLKHTIYVKAV